MKKMMMLVVALVLTMTVNAENTKWYNPMDGAEPYICGRAWNSEIGKTFSRLPERFHGKVTNAVWSLSRNSAGLYVRFNTNAKRIAVRYSVDNKYATHPNMAPLNHSGLDLYVIDHNGKEHGIHNQMNHNVCSAKDTLLYVYEDVIIPESGTHGFDYLLFLPTYNTTTYLSVGVDENCTFSFYGQEKEKPVVCYGSSICQGASASRPGLIWTNILKRETAYPYINLGFSGNALMESEIFDAMSEIDARAFIIDCIPNSFRFEGDGKTIEERFPAGIRKLRAKSNAPIIIAESIVAKDDEFVSKKDSRKVRANAILKGIFKQLKAEGMKNIYYITAEDFGLTREDYIEGTHPNDLGMVLYAKAYEKVLAKIGIKTHK